MNKCPIEKWIQLPVDGVVQQPIPDPCLMDISRLWVGNIESMISPMDICLVFELEMEGENVVGQPVLEILHVFFATLSFQKIFPRFEQIFDRNDSVVHVYLI